VVVRIIREPNLADMSFSGRFTVGRTYDLEPTVAEVLVLEGFAQIELRRRQRSTRTRRTDRRRTPQQ
jgi:hypothetical protein